MKFLNVSVKVCYAVANTPYMNHDETICYTYNICMVFEYDPKKAKTNWQKHGVSFAEAEMVFFDPLAIHDLDPDSITE